MQPLQWPLVLAQLAPLQITNICMPADEYIFGTLYKAKTVLSESVRLQSHAQVYPVIRLLSKSECRSWSKEWLCPPDRASLMFCHRPLLRKHPAACAFSRAKDIVLVGTAGDGLTMAACACQLGTQGALSHSRCHERLVSILSPQRITG